MANKITCTCGHSWNKSSSSKKDMKICHICGKDNTMKNGGWLDAYDEEMQLGGNVYPANYVPQAENGLEASTDGFTDQGFNYNGAWGGTMEDGGDIPQAQDGLWSTNKRAYVDSALNANKNLDWVKRLYDANPKAVMVPGEKYSSTHQIGDNDQGYVFPRIANMNGQLVDLGDSAEDYARETNTGIQFPKEQGTWFARSTGDNSGYKMGTGVLKGKPVMQKYKSIDKKEMGGAMPGSVGFSYARTKGIPDNGPYAKKTLASAQDGLTVDEQMAEASTNMWGYPTEPNFVEAYKKPTKKTTSKKTSAKSKSVKEETDEPDSFEEKKPSIDFRANRERPQMDALHSQTPIVLDRYSPYTGYIREGNSDPDTWKDNRSFFSDARAKERGDALWNVTKKATAIGQFSPEPVSRYSSIGLNSLMGAADAYFSLKDGDATNAKINAIGAIPLPGYGSIKALRSMPGLTSKQKSSILKSAVGALGVDLFGIGADLSDNFGLEKKQNGGEMSFYQNGLDWTPRNISRDGSEIPKAQIGTMVTPLDFSKPLGTLEGVSEVMSAPARTATYLLTGKYQDPSQALGIKNPWGALAADMVLDPMNLVGAGIASKIGKGVKAAKATKSVSKIVNNAAKAAKPTTISSSINKVKNLEDLNAAQQFAKQYGYDLPENLERIAQSDELTNRTVRGLMDRHNTFVRGVSTNWDVLAEKNPEILRHLEGKGFDLSTKEGSKVAAEYMATHIPINTGYGRASLNRDVFKKGLDALYTSNSVPTAEGYTYGQGYITKVKKPTDFSSFNRQDWISKNNPEYYEHSLPGGNELLVDGKVVSPINVGLPYLYDVEAYDNIDVFKNKVLKDLEKNAEQLKETYITKAKSNPTYSQNMKQSYDEIMKKIEDVKTQKWEPANPKYNKNLLKTENYTPVNKYAHYIHLGTPGEKVLEPIKSWEITPDIWKNKSRAHTNVYSKKLSALEKGGEITKDDNGYWNPENWGKPVEIGSNNITMQGVNQPLIGVSDTGDVQMMYPGEDYKFDGESVTEYPVAQLGKTVPPLNVSNPNDPRLKSYQDSLYNYNIGRRMAGVLDADKNLMKVRPGSVYDKKLQAGLKANNYNLKDNTKTDTQGYKNYEKVANIMKEYQGKGNRGILPIRFQGYFPDPNNTALDLVTLRSLWDKLGVTDPRPPGAAHLPEWKKPEQEVVLNPNNAPKKPQPKPQPVKKKPTPQPKPVQEQPIKKTEPPKPVEVKQNVYEGSPVYSNMLGDGARSALVGFANPQGDTTYIKPEDYQRYGVPAYGKELIESKTKKKKNGGWLDKYN